jgi:hypothetical protein
MKWAIFESLSVKNDLKIRFWHNRLHVLAQARCFFYFDQSRSSTNFAADRQETWYPRLAKNVRPKRRTSCYKISDRRIFN